MTLTIKHSLLLLVIVISLSNHGEADIGEYIGGYHYQGEYTKRLFIQGGEIGILVGFLACGGFLLLLGCLGYKLWKKHGGGRFEGTVQCHLCLERISDLKWSSGEHRRECDVAFRGKLESFREHHSKKCPLCHQRLRLWPQQGEPFKCFSSGCIHKGRDGPGYQVQRNMGRNQTLICNTGHNRFSCFLCNVNLCLQCVNTTSIEEAPTSPSIFNVSKSKENRALLPPPPSYEQAIKSYP